MTMRFQRSPLCESWKIMGENNNNFSFILTRKIFLLLTWNANEKWSRTEKKIEKYKSCWLNTKRQFYEKGRGILKNSFTVAPLAHMKQVLVTVNNLDLRHLKNNNEIGLVLMLTYKAFKLKNKEIGRSIVTAVSMWLQWHKEVRTMRQITKRKRPENSSKFEIMV